MITTNIKISDIVLVDILRHILISYENINELWLDIIKCRIDDVDGIHKVPFLKP